MVCCICRRSVESNLSFRPLDEKGTPNRRWICNECQGIEKETIERVLSKEELLQFKYSCS